MIGFIIQVIGAYVATIAAAVIVEAPRQFIFKTGFAGAGGYIGYLLMIDYAGSVMATFVASLIIVIMGQFFARHLKAPVTIFYIPSFFPLVPGSAMYLTAYNFINGDSASGAMFFVEALMIAGAIALAIFLIDSILEIYTHLKYKNTDQT